MTGTTSSTETAEEQIRVYFGQWTILHKKLRVVRLALGQCNADPRHIGSDYKTFCFDIVNRQGSP
jgi:hypothetical protein